MTLSLYSLFFRHRECRLNSPKRLACVGAYWPVLYVLPSSLALAECDSGASLPSYIFFALSLDMKFTSTCLASNAWKLLYAREEFALNVVELIGVGGAVFAAVLRGLFLLVRISV